MNEQKESGLSLSKENNPQIAESSSLIATISESAENVNSYESEQLISVVQLPIIEERLKTIKEAFSHEVEDALSLTCTDETIQIVKKKRSEITKIYNDLESRRKEVKKAVLAPYEAFEQIYKECVTSIYAPCDLKLKQKIAEVENGLKEQKYEDAKAYFAEYCLSKQIDFIDFSRLGLAITLTVSKKKLREQVKAFVDKVSDELELIETQENCDEILVEYKKSLNVAQAITTVVNRHKAIEEERRRKEAALEQHKDAEEAVAKVDEAIAAVAPPKAEAVDPELPCEPAPEPEKVYEVSFTVRGSIDKIRALKQFLTEGEYDYEQQ